MTDQEKQRFDALFAMFESDGWKAYVADLEFTAHQCNQLNAASDEKDFWQRKGMVTVLANLLGYEQAQRTIAEQDEAA